MKAEFILTTRIRISAETSAERVLIGHFLDETVRNSHDDAIELIVSREEDNDPKYGPLLSNPCSMDLLIYRKAKTQ